MFSPTTTQLPPVGATLKAMREGAGLSLETLAERAGTTAPTLSRFERGQRTVSAELLARVARVIADELAAKKASAA